MVFFAALLMSAAVFGLVAYPMLRPQRKAPARPPVDGRVRDELLARRDAAYAAIKELEFERQLGNLSEQDFEDLRHRYRDRAADVLHQLDALEREEAATRKGSQRQRRNGGAEDEIERAVAMLKQQQAASEATRAVSGACPTCHEPVGGGDRFCGNCGTDQHRFCPACSAPRQAGQRFCARCGERLTPPEPGGKG